MPTPPDVIAGRYRVLEEAGRGGMGAVYRCVDERLGREVAVKQVGRMPGESVTDRARALREARSTAALNHPHVVSVYDAVAEGDHVWLVMEYVPGRTLAQILHQEGRISPARAAWIGAQVADGLAAAHERGTVHRDVKPGNVLVGDADDAKISDFGIARTTGDANLTQSGILSGTPAYLAPEVARGEDPGPASDVWALGATLFRAVEGRPLFEHDANALALLATIASVEPPSPEQAGALTGPITRMLDRDPAARWSMSDAAYALHRVHDQLSPGAEGTREDTEALAAVAPVASPPTTAPPAAPAPAPVAAPDRRRRRGPLLVAAAVALLVGSIAAVLLLGGDPGVTPTADETSSESSRQSGGSQPEESEGTVPQETETQETEPAADVPEETEETQQTEGSATADPVAFVEDYYSVLPEDTETGWSLLSPSYRSTTTFADYDGFWDTIGEVAVLDATPVDGDAVDVTLRYDDAEEEVRRIFLEQADGSWQITDDEVVG